MQPAAVNWVEHRARHRRRRDVVTLIGNVVALHALALYVLLTLQRGRLAAIPPADHAVTGLVGILVAVDIALVLRPQPDATVIGRVVTLLGKLVLRPVTTLLLVVADKSNSGLQAFVTAGAPTMLKCGSCRRMCCLSTGICIWPLVIILSVAWTILGIMWA